MTKKEPEPSDFVDSDMFDPEVIEEYEKSVDRAVTLPEAQVQDYLDRRRRAYASVFAKGHTDQEDIDIVLNDLAFFCRAFSPTFNPNDGDHAETLMKIKEGRREVYQRILDHTRLSRDTLFLKYAGAQT